MKLLKLCHSSTSAMPSVQYHNPSPSTSGGGSGSGSGGNSSDGGNNSSSGGSSSSGGGSGGGGGGGGGSLSRQPCINTTRQPLLDMLLETRHGNALSRSTQLSTHIPITPYHTPYHTLSHTLSHTLCP